MLMTGTSYCVIVFKKKKLNTLLNDWLNIYVSLFTFYSQQAYELSTLTGTQVMLLVASETGHVYTFATRKLQPMITSESGKALIQTCLNSPDLPGENQSRRSPDQRMCATGFEETELSYSVSEEDEKVSSEEK